MSTINQLPPIAAIATPMGEGGIAVIQASGKNAIQNDLENIIGVIEDLDDQLDEISEASKEMAEPTE